MGRMAFVTDVHRPLDIEWRHLGSSLWWLCVLWALGEMLLATVACSYNSLKERVVLPGEV